MNKTILSLIAFGINLLLVGILSSGAAFFTLVPFVMGFTEPHRIISMVTQNMAMKGLWIFYFINIVFLVLNWKYVNKILNITYLAIFGSFVLFVVFITGVLPDCLSMDISILFGILDETYRCS